MSGKTIYYADKYYDDIYEYRHVIIPKDMVQNIPKGRLMTEREWRGMGIQQSPGWVHFMHHAPEPHVLLFRRPITDHAEAKVFREANNNYVGKTLDLNEVRWTAFITAQAMPAGASTLLNLHCFR